MLKLAKWAAIVILLPLIVLKEIWTVLKDAGIEVPDADAVLNNIKEAKAQQECTPEKDYSDKIDI